VQPHLRFGCKRQGVIVLQPEVLGLSIRWLRVRVPSPSLNRSSRKIKTCGYSHFTDTSRSKSVWGQFGDTARVALRWCCWGHLGTFPPRPARRASSRALLLPGAFSPGTEKG
jgi:hypothetical protein